MAHIALGTDRLRHIRLLLGGWVEDLGVDAPAGRGLSPRHVHLLTHILGTTGGRSVCLPSLPGVKGFRHVCGTTASIPAPPTRHNRHRTTFTATTTAPRPRRGPPVAAVVAEGQFAEVERGTGRERHRATITAGPTWRERPRARSSPGRHGAAPSSPRRSTSISCLVVGSSSTRWS